MQTNAIEVKNPYWDIVQTYPGDEVYQEIYGRWVPDWCKIMLKGGKSRNELCREYAWAIPSPEALAFAAKHLAPNAIEIGAGTGYWASLLSQMGVSMLCFDANPPHTSHKNDYHSPRESEYGKLSGETREVYYDVQQGDHTKAAEYPDHTLFLCWPLMTTVWALTVSKPTQATSLSTLVKVMAAAQPMIASLRCSLLSGTW